MPLIQNINMKSIGLKLMKIELIGAKTCLTSHFMYLILQCTSWGCIKFRFLATWYIQLWLVKFIYLNFHLRRTLWHTLSNCYGFEERLQVTSRCASVIKQFRKLSIRVQNPWFFFPMKVENLNFSKVRIFW